MASLANAKGLMRYMAERMYGQLTVRLNSSLLKFMPLLLAFRGTFRQSGIPAEYNSLPMANRIDLWPFDNQKSTMRKFPLPGQRSGQSTAE